jgi:hypothetical protein
MSSIQFAKHKKGATICVEDTFDLEIDPSLFRHHIEHLENNRSLVISKDEIFGIIGVGQTFYQSQSALRWNILKAIQRRLLSSTVLTSYLQDKGFELSNWAQVANLDPKLPVTIKDQV